MLGSTIQLSLGKRTTQVSRAAEFFREWKGRVNTLLQGCKADERECRELRFPQDTGLMERPEMMGLGL